MIERQVTAVKRDKDNIIQFCGICGQQQGLLQRAYQSLIQDGWSPRSGDNVIKDIESKKYFYYVAAACFDLILSKKIKITVVTHVSGKKYLRTKKNQSLTDNLDNLPPCKH